MDTMFFNRRATNNPETANPFWAMMNPMQIEVCDVDCD